MPSLSFSGAVICTMSGKNDGGSVKRLIHVRTNPPTKEVRRAMKWDELPDCGESMSLVGELVGKVFVLTPNDEKLEKFGIEMHCSLIDAFELNRIQDKDGGGRKVQLRFVIKTEQKGALARLEHYVESVGEGAATLKLGYEEQEELPLKGDTSLSVIVDGKVVEKVAAAAR